VGATIHHALVRETGPIAVVRLVVADLRQVQTFYERAIGLRVLERADDVLRLGPPGTSS